MNRLKTEWLGDAGLDEMDQVGLRRSALLGLQSPSDGFCEEWVFEDRLREDSSEDVSNGCCLREASDRPGRVPHATQGFFILPVSNGPGRGRWLPSEGCPSYHGRGLASFEVGLHRMDGRLAVPSPGDRRLDKMTTLSAIG